jgi:hypothetical protein
MEQQIYDKLVPIVAESNYTDVEISYTVDMCVEKATVTLHYDENDTSMITILFLRKFNVLPQFTIMTRNTDDIDKEMERSIINVAMPLNGTKINSSRQSTPSS